MEKSGIEAGGTLGGELGAGFADWVAGGANFVFDDFIVGAGVVAVVGGGIVEVFGGTKGAGVAAEAGRVVGVAGFAGHYALRICKEFSPCCIKNCCCKRKILL